MIRRIFAGIAVSLTLSVSVVGAQANDLKNCIAQVAEMDVGNKTAFHNGMRNLIVAQAPQFEELAGVYRDMQTALVEKRHRQLQYLLFTDPERLAVDEGISKLANYDWDEKDTARMAALAPEYKALVERIGSLKTRNQSHGDWPALREFVAQTLSRHTGHKALMARLWKGRDAASAHLKSCRGN